MITREEITWLYRCIFGRAPESDAAIEGHLHTHASFDSARMAFLASSEFTEMYKRTCERRVFYRPPTCATQSFRKTEQLALAAIVKNEAKRMPDFIESCSDLVDFIAILDTHSSDNTVAVTKEALSNPGVPPHRLETCAFVDFAQARNQAIRLVPNRYRWILMLDADERIMPEDFAKLISLMEDKEKDAWTLPRYNFVDMHKLLAPENYPDRQARLFQNKEGVVYVGRVHENLIGTTNLGHVPAADADQEFELRGPHIHHIGTAERLPDEAVEKNLFYASLLDKPIS